MPRRNADAATQADRDSEDRARRADEARSDAEFLALLEFYEPDRPPDPWELVEFGAWFRPERPPEQSMPETEPREWALPERYPRHPARLRPAE
jgi:hypothetical protein